MEKVLGKHVCAGLIILTAAPHVLASGSPGVIYSAVFKLAIMFGLAIWVSVAKVQRAAKVDVWSVLAVGLSYLVVLGFVPGYLMNFVWIEVSSIAVVLACTVYVYQTLLNGEHRD